MTLRIYSVHDVKAGTFATPFFVPTEGLARRAFVDLCRDTRTTISQHPEDFALFYLGEFIQESGEVRYPEALQPVSVMTGLEARVAAIKCEKQAAELQAVADDPAS